MQTDRQTDTDRGGGGEGDMPRYRPCGDKAIFHSDRLITLGINMMSWVIVVPKIRKLEVNMYDSSTWWLRTRARTTPSRLSTTTL